MRVLFECMYEHGMHAWCTQRTERGSDWMVENQYGGTGAQHEQCVLLRPSHSSSPGFRNPFVCEDDCYSALCVLQSKIFRLLYENKFFHRHLFNLIKTFDQN